MHLFLEILFFHFIIISIILIQEKDKNNIMRIIMYLHYINNYDTIKCAEVKMDTTASSEIKNEKS